MIVKSVKDKEKKKSIGSKGYKLFILSKIQGASSQALPKISFITVIIIILF